MCETRTHGSLLLNGDSLTTLFLEMRNELVREATLLDDAIDRISALLPASWRLEALPSTSATDRRVDAVIRMVGPDALTVPFVVEVKRSGAVSASVLVRLLRELERASGMPALFVTDYVGPALREALTSEGFSFADGTGWVRVTSDAPLVLLTGQGATRSPRPPRSSAITRLNGVAASRIIRALTTADLPVGVRRLADLADVSAGSVSKLLVTFASEGIVDRDAAGRVVFVRRRAMLQRWVIDYSFTKTNSSVGYFIATRGLERVLARLASQKDVALTGSAAARRLLPESSTSVVPLRLLAIYAAHPAEVVEELGLLEAEPATANVVVARPQDPDMLDARDEGDFATAPIGLVIADLLTLPGRSDAEADQLVDALAAADAAWKE